MEPPDPIDARLDDEPVEAVVSLGGDDAIAVTPTRTLVYRAEGLLRDESIAEYPHDVDRVTCSVGRRKGTIGMAYVDETREFTVPKDAVDDVLAPVVGGILGVAGAIDTDTDADANADAGEAVTEVFRFSELTLVVTDRRVVKHVGAVLWDEEYESYDYADVTDLAVEEGTVATQLVLEVDGRPRRIKTPSDRARQVRRAIEDELLAYHDVESVGDLPASDAGGDEPADGGSASASEEGDDGQIPEASTASDDVAPDASAAVEPLLDAPGESNGGEADAPASAEAPESAGGAGTAESDAGTDSDGDVGDVAVDDADDAPDEAGGFRFGKSPDDDEVAARLTELTAAVERQNELLERQQETIQRLVEELRRGR